jgi:hypothetical protein
MRKGPGNSGSTFKGCRPLQGAEDVTQVGQKPVVPLPWKSTDLTIDVKDSHTVYNFCCGVNWTTVSRHDLVNETMLKRTVIVEADERDVILKELGLPVPTGDRRHETPPETRVPMMPEVRAGLFSCCNKFGNTVAAHIDKIRLLREPPIYRNLSNIKALA